MQFLQSESSTQNRMGFESVFRKSPICQYATACYYDHHRLPMFAFHYHKKVPYLSNQLSLSNSNTSVCFTNFYKIGGKMTNTFPILNQSQNINALCHSINASFTQFESPLTQSLSTSILMYLPPCYCCISFF
ncbi:hypothetical protein V8G54_018419 [Vigna mungo]|uniref:Uncharacterized protein n=1 Tax=Vigna mungo TaxID=3915 RepID=A0AAQ3RTY9_VIGMU